MTIPRHDQDTGYVTAAEHNYTNFGLRQDQRKSRARQEQLRRGYNGRHEPVETRAS